MKPEQFIRPEIRRIVPYRSAREAYAQEAAVWLDANENGYDLSGQGLHRYPDPLQRRLKQQIARWKGVSPEQIFLGNGSDEAIDLLIRATCRPFRDEILITPPTYGMYRVLAEIQGVGVQQVGLDHRFQPDVLRIVRSLSLTTRLIFLCSPNNPTGNVLEPKAVETLLETFAGLVVIDEAYIDFADHPGWLGRLNRYPNLVILQSFSKAPAMAGARLGMAFAQAEIIAILNTIKYPYNVNVLTLRAAELALQRRAETRAVIERIKQQRAWLEAELRTLPHVIRVFPSRANFLLVRFRQAETVFRYLIRRGIVVRNRSHLPGCEGCLRITVGTEKENQLLMKTLRAMEVGE